MSLQVRFMLRTRVGIRLIYNKNDHKQSSGIRERFDSLLTDVSTLLTACYEAVWWSQYRYVATLSGELRQKVDHVFQSRVMESSILHHYIGTEISRQQGVYLIKSAFNRINKHIYLHVHIKTLELNGPSIFSEWRDFVETLKLQAKKWSCGCIMH